MGQLVEDYPDDYTQEAVARYTGLGTGTFDKSDPTTLFGDYGEEWDNDGTTDNPTNILTLSGSVVTDLLPGTENNDKSSCLLWGIWNIASQNSVNKISVVVRKHAENAVDIDDGYAAIKVSHGAGTTTYANLEKLTPWPTSPTEFTYEQDSIDLDGVTKVEFALGSETYGTGGAAPRIETKIDYYKLTIDYTDTPPEEVTFKPYMIVI
jgi:hypothetical protein